MTDVRFFRRGRALGVLAVAVVGVAAGSATAASGGGSADQLVAKQSQPVAWQTPGPRIKVGTQLKGKTVYFLANGLNFPFVQDMLSGIKESARQLGMKVTTGDGAGSSAKAAQLMQQAIGQKAAVIIDEGFPTTQLSAPVRAAKKAGIPVLEFGNGDPRLPTGAAKKNGVSGIATFCYSCAGREMADLAIAQSGGKASAVVYNVPGISVSPVMVKAIKSEFARLCPDCKVQVVDAPLAQWSTLLPSLTTSSLRSDPSVNYLLPLFDSMIAQIRPAAIQAGAVDRVKIISYNGTLPAMTDLQKGNQLVSGIVGGAPQWVGWGMMDQAARILTGKKPVASEKIPNRTFTPENIKSVNLKLPTDKWYGKVDFRDQYRRLWGFKS
jgi:ribose transport system substrate-binding protein